MEYALEIDNLYKQIGKKDIVHDFNLQLKYGEMVGLIGANGAGKSTVVKCVTGLWHFKKGTVKICGHTLKDEFEKCMMDMAAIVEYPKLFTSLTLLENVNYFKAFYKEFEPVHLTEWLNILNLDEAKHKKIKDFSSGMQQKACLLVVMLRNPKLLILDEPTSMLDPKSAYEVRKFLEKLNSDNGLSMLISSHNLNEVETLCNRAIVLDKGKILKTINLTKKELPNLMSSQSLEQEFISSFKEV